MDIWLAGKSDGVDAAIARMEQHGIRSTAHADPTTMERAKATKPAGWLERPYSKSAPIVLIKTALSART